MIKHNAPVKVVFISPIRQANVLLADKISTRMRALLHVVIAPLDRHLVLYILSSYLVDPS